MIINRGIVVDINNQQQIFDYAGCTYPEGNEEKNVFYFNEENIDRVIFNGFSDEEDERYLTLLKQCKNENRISKVDIKK